VLMAQGRIVADGPTDQVRRQTSGRIVRARLEPIGIERAAATIRDAIDVHRIDVDGDRLTIETPDSDTAARLLLGELGGSSLEIEAASLESAFLRLTNCPDTDEISASTTLTTQGATR